VGFGSVLFLKEIFFMKKYVVFYTNGNVQLGNFLVKRANELGYKGDGCMLGISVTLCTTSGHIFWTDKGHIESKEHKGDHEYGNFEDFLTTDRYKFTPPKPPIYAGDYEVNFLKNGGINVGCTTIDKNTVEKIIKRYNEVNQKNQDEPF
jgi:hypothetical protein